MPPANAAETRDHDDDAACPPQGGAPVVAVVLAAGAGTRFRGPAHKLDARRRRPPARRPGGRHRARRRRRPGRRRDGRSAGHDARTRASSTWSTSAGPTARSRRCARHRRPPASSAPAPSSSGSATSRSSRADAWRAVAAADAADRRRDLRRPARPPGPAAPRRVGPAARPRATRGPLADAPSTRSRGCEYRAMAHRSTSTPWRISSDGRTTRQRVHGQPADRRGVGGDHRRRADRAVPAGRPAAGDRGRHLPRRREDQARLDHAAVQGPGHVRRARRRRPHGRCSRPRAATPAAAATRRPRSRRTPRACRRRAPGGRRRPTCTSPARSPSSAAASSATCRRS